MAAANLECLKPRYEGSEEDYDMDAIHDDDDESWVRFKDIIICAFSWLDYPRFLALKLILESSPEIFQWWWGRGLFFQSCASIESAHDAKLHMNKPKCHPAVVA